ncbi:probable RNA-binding protein 18 [Condylostylus longicornis]|uniref:probable RNA-binding protein 18 n=1 Tax=Condylostylus longicornis TaxID=2530218 RepID=UPI00244E0E1E|nr:probable RNA-binding protein 18 [Condylostylus longicornis]
MDTLEDRRLWIGNLDPRITEYQLLKILQKYGDIEKFDLLFHKSGPLAGQPRGYAFVTYKSTKDSACALDKLNGKLVGIKNVAVRLAKNINYDELEKPKPKIEIPVLAAGVSKQNKISKELAIEAIQAKLDALQKNSDDDFEINKTAANSTPFIQKYQFNKNNTENPRQIKNSRHPNHKYRNVSKPYNKIRPPKR